MISFLFGKNNGPNLFLLKYSIIINIKQNNIIKNSVIIKVPAGPDIGTDLFWQMSPIENNKLDKIKATIILISMI